MLENEEKNLITELENESENVLELINTKLESWMFKSKCENYNREIDE